jgi:hypothetical protein
MMFLIEISVEIFADIGVDWVIFISKIMKNKLSFLRSIINSFDCLFSMKIRNRLFFLGIFAPKL